MSQVAMYVDGFNLYHAIDELERPELKWVNLYALAKSYLKEHDALVSVRYFTAVVTWDANTAARHREYLAGLAATGATIHQSNFSKVRRFCAGEQRHCNFREEKQT